jgi:hypothetical protein
MNELDQLLVNSKELERRLDVLPTEGWATVTSTSPLKVRFDGEASSVAAINRCGGLAVGNRVIARIYNGQLRVVNKLGGVVADLSGYATVTALNAGLAGKANTSHTHTLSQLTDYPSAVSATELSYLDGVTSAIQTQLNGKAASSHTHTVSQISDLTATATELNYVDGVTSNVQTQLNGKAPTSHTHTVSQLSDTTVTAAQLNFVVGVTSAIQTQLNGKAASSHTHTASQITDLSSVASSETISTTPAGTLTWRLFKDDSVEVFWESSGNVTQDVQYTIATLPSNVRPTYNVPVAVSGGVYGDRPAGGTVFTDGTVKVRNQYSSALALKLHGYFRLG